MVEVCRAITKHHYLVQNAKDIARIVKEAFHIASTGRPGPVLIDVPKDIQNTAVPDPDYDVAMDLPGYHLPPPPSGETVRAIAEAIKASRRPIVYCGGGVIASGAAEELREFVNKTGIPVAMTLQGLKRRPVGPLSQPRHARDARHGLLELRDQRGGPAPGAGRPVRRPRDGQAQRVRQARADRPRRHRRLRDQQEQGRAPRGELRRQVDPRRAESPGREGRVARVAQADRRRPRGRPDGLRPARRRDHPAVRHRPVLEAHERRFPDDDGRRPASDVGRAVHQVHESADLGHLGRPRLDGLRPPRRDGGAGRLPGFAGGRHRRRRLVRDEYPGARHAVLREPAGEDDRAEQPAPRHGGSVGGSVPRRQPRPHLPRPGRPPRGDGRGQRRPPRDDLSRLRDDRQGLRRRRPADPPEGRRDRAPSRK